jgi:homoserine kinase
MTCAPSGQASHPHLPANSSPNRPSHLPVLLPYAARLPRGPHPTDNSPTVAKPGPTFQFPVPASAANLGPGYGVLAVALDLALQVTADVRTDGAVSVVRRDDPDSATHDPRHGEVLRGLHKGLELLGAPLGKGLTITIEGIVPRGSGLGTISAGFAAGLGVAARMAQVHKRRQPIDQSLLLDALIRLGGDPAHGGASLLGGLVAAVPTSQPQEQEQRHRLTHL